MGGLSFLGGGGGKGLPLGDSDPSGKEKNFLTLGGGEKGQTSSLHYGGTHGSQKGTRVFEAKGGEGKGPLKVISSLRTKVKGRRHSLNQGGGGKSTRKLIR